MILLHQEMITLYLLCRLPYQREALHPLLAFLWLMIIPARPLPILVLHHQDRRYQYYFLILPDNLPENTHLSGDISLHLMILDTEKSSIIRSHLVTITNSLDTTNNLGITNEVTTAFHIAHPMTHISTSPYQNRSPTTSLRCRIEA